MTSGIYYLYEYHTNKKIRNVGFLKIVQQQSSYILQISARQIPITQQEQASLYILLFENEKLMKKPLASIPCQNHLISARLPLSNGDLPDNHQLDEVDGFLLQLPEGQLYVASLPEVPFSTDILYEQEDPKEDIKEQLPEEEISKEEISKDIPEISEEIIHTEDEELESFPQQEEEFSPPEVSTHELQEESYPKARKIERSEITTLPKHYWSLANNSFLMHGYHNYHHLLLIEDDGQFWLGVPGIYTAREARAAALFGFPQFTRDYTNLLDLSEEYEPDEDFGYWCRWLK